MQEAPEWRATMLDRLTRRNPTPTEWFPRGANRSRPAVAAPYCRHMGDLILGAVLLWLAVFSAFGTNLVLRDGRRERVLGVSLIALGLVPCLIALWLGT